MKGTYIHSNQPTEGIVWQREKFLEEKIQESCFEEIWSISYEEK